MDSRNVRTDKRGGICFRVDDNKPIRQWVEFAEVFDRYGFKFCAALCPGRMAGDEDYTSLVRSLQDRGHEIMDHTPLHSVDKLPLPQGADADAWRAMPGVDHVDATRVYLTYAPIHAASLTEYRADVSGNLMTARTPQDLNDANQTRFIAVYLPQTGSVFRFRQIERSGDVVLALRSFWDEDNVDLGELRDVAYHKLSKADVRMTLDARRLLAESSLKLFENLGLDRPLTWIQPGSGGCSDFWRGDVKSCFGDLYGYVAAATYPDRSLKCFNEDDPGGDKCFGMQWGDFNDEARDLDWNLKRIADGIAGHRVLIGHSHFWEHVMPDDWEGYLERVDGILAWCKANRVPVRTYSKWAEVLYRSTPDPNVNVIPELNVDLNGDGVPDGYDIRSAELVQSSGVPDANGAFLSVQNAGTICKVDRLGGLEKGANTFSVWISGQPGDSIEATFGFFEVETTETLAFSVKNPEWTEQRATVGIPDGASQVNISIECTHTGGGILKIGRMRLKAHC
ncbi:MAG: hypothetical protein OXU79_12705 [Gemmatimonadota bacterium]|nr:hypothetical protein [Gemmatimonadota bacterium]